MTETLNRAFPRWEDETLNHLPKADGFELTCAECLVKWVGDPFEDADKVCWCCGEPTGKPKYSWILRAFKKIPTPTV